MCYACCLCLFVCFWQEKSQRLSWGSLENISFGSANAQAMIACCVLWEEIYLSSLRIWTHFIATSPSRTRCQPLHKSIDFLIVIINYSDRRGLCHIVPGNYKYNFYNKSQFYLWAVVLLSHLCHYLISVRISGAMDSYWAHSLLQALLELLLKTFSTLR